MTLNKINKNMIEDLPETLDEVMSSLAENAKKLNDNPVKPEDFNGTDFEKLQQAFDYAISQKRPLQISKTYNIKNNTISINKGFDVREPLFVYGGGKITKDVAGYIFDGSNEAISDIFFQNIHFEGVKGIDVSVFNTGAAELIRIHTNMCYFKFIKDVFHSTTYIQDIKMSKDTIVECSGSVVNTSGIYLFTIDSLTMEKSSGQVIVQTGTEVNNNSSINCKISNSVIEGFNNASKPLFDIKRGAITLDNNYFESVPFGVVKIGTQGTVLAENNTLYGDTNNGFPFATLGTSSYGISEFKNNIIPNSPVVDATLLTGSAKVVVSGNDSNINNIDPNKKIYDYTRDMVNNSLQKLGTNFTRAIISKSVVDTNKVDLLTIELPPLSGAYVVIRGGGYQNGVFGINKAFKIVRGTGTSLTITSDTDDSWGSPSLQHENIFLEVHNTYYFMLRANSKSTTATQYDLVVEVYGKSTRLTIN